MTVTSNTRLAGGALVGALLLAACADSSTTAPSLMHPTAGSQAITIIGGLTPPAGTDWGQVRLCKTGSATGTFTYQVSVDGGAPFAVDIDAGSCEIIYDSPAGGGVTETISIVEDDPAPSVLTDIDIERFIPDGYVVPGNPSATFDVPTRTATAPINSDLVVTVTFENTFTPPTGNEGCTPGYWKQEHHFDSWPAAYDPSDSFNAVFGIGTNWFPNSFTLLDALSAGGGGIRALARHAVAALLNAESGFYPLTPGDVIDAVQDAYNGTGDIEDTKNDFEDNNELGCPLN
jgi:hypothetical protein